MLSIPWKYITENISLPNYTPAELGEKLTYSGLETKVVEHKNNFYLEFIPLPNRPDLSSWQGIIQEIAILLNCQVKPINFPVINESEEKLIEVAINTPDCREFHLGLIKNIAIKESPFWLKECLEINNIRPVNSVVDITNLIMLESGQPLHIFDYDTLPEKKIIVRPAQKGEKINTLQGQGLTLNPEDTVISSGGKIINLAGIIGAKEYSLTSQTKNILIEVADFNPEVIGKSAKRLNISTATSQFFDRRSNLILPLKQVFQQAISLIIETYEGNLESGKIFTYQEKKAQEQPTIVISQDFIEKKVGQKFSEEIIENIWKQLNFSYQKKENAYYITRTVYRPDIFLPEDLLEELLKVYDYNKVNSFLPSDFPPTFLTSNQENKKKGLKVYLVNCGWQEIITYSLISQEMKEEFKENEGERFYQLLVSKNEYHKYYRQTLIPSHLKTIRYNLSHGNKNLFFFEISSVASLFQQEDLLILSGTGKLTKQPFHHLNQTIDFYWIKGVLENIFRLWQIESATFFSPIALNYLSASQSAAVLLGKEKIGFLGQISPQIAQNYQINETVFVAQVSLSKIFNYLNNFPPKISYQPVSNFPISEKDLSFLVPENINYNEVNWEIKNTGGENLREVSLFDVYQNPEMKKKGQKSISFHLIFQSSFKTLESREIEKVINAIVQKIEKLFAAKLRD